MLDATPTADRVLNTPGAQSAGITPGSYVLVIVILLLVLLAAYFTTRFIAGRGRSFARGKYLRVKENLYLGRDKSVMLLESSKEYYIIGATNQQMQLLGTIPKAELTVLPEEATSGSMEGLRGTLSRVYENAKGARSAPADLRKAQAAYREANPEAASGRGRDVLQILRRTPAHEAPSFVESLQDADARMQPQGEPPSVIVDISTPVETEQRLTPEALQRKEDEIDRMMQSIEQRTQELRQRRGKDSQDEDS